MRKVKCSQCNKYFLENDGNPNIHYSTPESICFHCKIFNKKPIGSWYQDSDGNYKLKK